MQSKYFIAGVIIFTLVVVGTKLTLNKLADNRLEADETELAQFKKPINIYTDHGEIYTVAFNEDGSKAILNGLAFKNMKFDIATSGSSARYEDTSKVFILWNKGDKFTLYREENTIMFVGSTNKADYEFNSPQ